MMTHTTHTEYDNEVEHFADIHSASCFHTGYQYKKQRGVCRLITTDKAAVCQDTDRIDS